MEGFSVERLIRMRRPLPDEDDCDEAVALASHGLAGPEEILRASRHLESCALCRESLLALSSFDTLENADEMRTAPAVEPKPRVHAISKKYALIAAAAVLIAGIAAVLTISRPWSTGPKPGEGLVVKGPADRLQIAVQRDEVQFTARPLDRLLEGDRLGLFYSADKAGYLAVIDMDDEGQTTILYPSGSPQSAPMAAGVTVPIPDGAIVRDGEGCEWVVAVFSDKPLSTAFLKESIGRANLSRQTCELEIDIPGTRQIRILPFRR
jgi:hypothetical protein